MSDLSQLTPEQEREYEAYGDGVEVGINSLLRDLKRAYQDAEPYSGTQLAAFKQVLMNYGVDLDEVETAAQA